MKKDFKQNNAITLIALVITIIVLLILAGVTIVTLTGDNGLITKAGEAKQTVNEAEIEERVKLAYQDFFLGRNTETGYTFQQALNKIFREREITVTESKGVYTLSIENGKKYSFNPETKEFAEIIWTQDGITVTNTQTGQTLKVGDTVYYDSGVADYEGEEIQGKWGILGAEDGKVLIVSKENIGTLALSGKQDYLTDGSIKLNNACSSYKNAAYAHLARSINLDDLKKLDTSIGSTVTSHIYTMTDNGYVQLDDKSPSTWSRSFTNIDGEVLSKDKPIYVNETNNEKYFRVYDKTWNMLNPNGNSYWINSQYCVCGGACAYWGFYTITNHNLQANGQMYNSFGSGGATSGVRAVVYIKSNVKLSGNSTDGWIVE